MYLILAVYGDGLPLRMFSLVSQSANLGAVRLAADCSLSSELLLVRCLRAFVTITEKST